MVRTDDLESNSARNAAAQEDAVRIAHVYEHIFDSWKDCLRSIGTDHEGQRSCLGTHRSATDGSIDKVDLRAILKLLRQFCSRFRHL